MEPRPTFRQPQSNAGSDQSQDATTLGPLADEPRFEPNPGLPPNRPSYQAGDPRADGPNLTLHPVGRVPPGGEPIAVRPSPPPMPVEPAPRQFPVVRAALAALVALLALGGLLFAMMQLQGGGNGSIANDDNAIALAATATREAELDERATVQAAAALLTPEADQDVEEQLTGGPGGDDDVVAAEEAAEAPPAPATATATPENQATATVEATEPAEATAPTQRRLLVTTNPTALLPSETDVPEGLLLNEDSDRTEEEVAATFADPVEAAELLNQWGWNGNVYRDFLPAEGADAVPSYLNVSVHRFRSAAAASEALTYFADAVILGQGLTTVEVEPIGDEIIALTGDAEGTSLVVLYVRAGPFLIRIGGSSVGGDPLEAVLTLGETILEP